MKVIGENEVKIQLKSSTGPMGPAGPQGPKGDKGDRGETGPRGLTGATGLKGDKGDKGDRGEKGATGAQGPQGEKGEKGETGATGAQGPQGEKGETGATGPQGPQGETGPQGIQGEKGDTGPQGPKGEKGDTGPQGPAGSIDNLPVASATQLGGVKPVAKTDEMTQAVGVDEAGGLWALPGGGITSMRLLRTITVSPETDVYEFDTDDKGNAFNVREMLFAFDGKSHPVNGYGNLYFNDDYAGFRWWPTVNKIYIFCITVTDKGMSIPYSAFKTDSTPAYEANFSVIRNFIDGIHKIMFKSSTGMGWSSDSTTGTVRIFGR